MMAAERQCGVPLSRLLGDRVAEVDVPACPMAGLALDSRGVVPGGAFVALAGHAAHGLDYLDPALRRGAAAILYPAGDPRFTAGMAARCARAGALALAVPDLSGRLGTIAARFHGEPAARLERVIAVTGTNGKSSVSHYVATMLDDPDAPAGVVGTLGRGRPGDLWASGLTTPDAVGFHAALAELADAGIRRLAVEASSHGLAQHRLDGTPIDVAVLTQLGRDHLDYHADAAAYAAAKARLFHWPGLRAAVLNGDDAFGRRLRDELPDSVAATTYGRDAGDLHARAIRPRADGLALDLMIDGDARPIEVPLLGAFNVDNLLAAAGVLRALGYEPDAIANRTARVRAVPGRMELFRAPGCPGVVVDYAHNPGALAAALAALRPHTAGRLWCIFGAGGDRDRGKRPLMGAAAREGADRLIVTDDNPRGEAPATIVGEILSGIADADAIEVEHDRGTALQRAFDRAAPDDLILLAGKGHEPVQVRGTQALAWSDRDAARAVLGGDP